MVKNIYVYVVLFATLMMVIGGGVGVFISASNILFPETYYQSFEDYKMMQKDRALMEKGEPAKPQATDAELLKLYEQMVLKEQEREERRAWRSLIQAIGWIIIPLPVFIYFRRSQIALLLEKNKNSE